MLKKLFSFIGEWLTHISDKALESETKETIRQLNDKLKWDTGMIDREGIREEIDSEKDKLGEISGRIRNRRISRLMGQRQKTMAANG